MARYELRGGTDPYVLSEVKLDPTWNDVWEDGGLEIFLDEPINTPNSGIVSPRIILSAEEAWALWEELGRQLAPHRLERPTKEYDHPARPDDSAEPGDRCKDCGDDVTWVGPSMDDWLHVDDPDNR